MSKIETSILQPTTNTSIIPDISEKLPLTNSTNNYSLPPPEKLPNN
ncbi:hypothetical protein IQ270_29260 [Microcoleus sp. LEGE 07076]|nr:hypothetical protein [Microcoleus sp. LEGE 07076]MBE9188610.1 hypothetical protein [Microcoleus sp. LEGE 07076]